MALKSESKEVIVLKTQKKDFNYVMKSLLAGGEVSLIMLLHLIRRHFSGIFMVETVFFSVPKVLLVCVRKLLLPLWTVLKYCYKLTTNITLILVSIFLL